MNTLVFRKLFSDQFAKLIFYIICTIKYNDKLHRSPVGGYHKSELRGSPQGKILSCTHLEMDKGLATW